MSNVDGDLLRRFADFKWREFLKNIERDGEPSKARLAEMIQRHGVPECAREYVSTTHRRERPQKPRLGRLTGAAALTDDEWRRAVAEGRADPATLRDAIRGSMGLSRGLRAADLTWKVHAYRAAFRLQNVSPAKQRAIEAVASDECISHLTLRDILRRALPKEYSDLKRYDDARYKALVRDVVSSGRARLDRRHGLVDE